MIVHIILFEPRADLSADATQQVLEDLKQAAAAIPSVRRCRVGRRILHGMPGYEQTMREAYTFAAILEFDDREGLLTYLAHPAHNAAGRHFTSSAQRALAYDYEVVDASAANISDLR